MVWVAVFLLVLLLMAFWTWMFMDMAQNQSLPRCFIRIRGATDPRTDWVMAFLALNIITACYYYSNVYRNKH